VYEGCQGARKQPLPAVLRKELASIHSIAQKPLFLANSEKARPRRFADNAEARVASSVLSPKPKLVGV
jgi:hypothetical protein